MRWAGHVAHVTVCTSFWSEGLNVRDYLGEPGRDGGIIKMYLKEK